VHILPRQEGDFERNDDVYDKLEDWAPTSIMSQDKSNDKVKLGVPDDDDRKDRTMRMMEEESEELKNALLGIEAKF
jgi:bis(5'-adenosyl)-triphosphatase